MLILRVSGIRNDRAVERLGAPSHALSFDPPADSVINAIRAHLAEFGITAPVGRRGFEELLRVVADPSDKRVPELVRSCRDLIRGGHYGQLLWTIKSLILWPFVGENG